MVLLAGTGTVLADSSVSPNFRIDESFIGGGGDVQSSSPNFKSDAAIGDIGIGESAGTAFQTQSGSVTTSDPALTLTVPSSSISFGALSTAATRTGSSTFKVINYTSFGYIVQVIGSPPSSGTHSLNNMASTALSQTGQEQFGINLVANSLPTTLGANPLNVFSNSTGVAAAGYATVNNYKYVSGNTIASAPKTSAETDYTISYIVNASTTTPGGSYSGALTLVCTGTY
jgi:hypothetical protein